MGQIILADGFCFDYEYLLAPKLVTVADIEEIAAKLAAAHQAVDTIRQTGQAVGHLSKDGQPEAVLFTQLPYIQDGNLNTPAGIARLKEFGQAVRNQVDAVISFGVGGSYLGNRVLFDINGGELWNQRPQQERNGYPQLYFSGNNIDPRSVRELVDHLQRQAAQKTAAGQGRLNVTLIVISKSGGTLDTMACFMAAYQALVELAATIDVEVATVTGYPAGSESSLLYRLAEQHNWPCFAVPEGVGGRFSVFSNAGLITAACLGFDIDGFLAGARAMDQACRTAEVWSNPAMLNAACKFLAAEKYGRNIEVFMPYADCLKSTAEWYVQLLAESLGKRLNRQGRQVCYGRTPLVAVGTTDMHAQTQLHQDGCDDKIVQFVKIAAWAQDMVIPNIFTEKKLQDIAGVTLAQAMEAACQSNAEALAGDGRPSAAYILPELNAYYLGELLYLLALSVAYEGELADVDAYDQPGVENYKRRLAQKLVALKDKN